MIDLSFRNQFPSLDRWYEEGYWNISSSSSTLQRKNYLLMFGISFCPSSQFSIFYKGPIYHILENWGCRRGWSMTFWWYFDSETDFSSTITFKEMVLWCKIQSSKIYENWRSFRSSSYSIILYSMWLSKNSYSCSNVCWFMYLWMWLL